MSARAWAAVLTGAFVSACAAAPRKSSVERKAELDVRLVFDTGPSWWTDPEKECPQWAAALPLARQMAGCSDDYVGDAKHRCQVAIRRCSRGCDVCQNLKPGQGADTEFGAVRQLPKDEVYATTTGPWLFGGYDTRFDPAHVCGSAKLLAKVMIHEAVHACRAAGGDQDLYDKGDVFRRGAEGCYAEQVAPVGEGKACGDS